jgi:hypothetical protein
VSDGPDASSSVLETELTVSGTPRAFLWAAGPIASVLRVNLSPQTTPPDERTDDTTLAQRFFSRTKRQPATKSWRTENELRAATERSIVIRSPWRMEPRAHSRS